MLPSIGLRRKIIIPMRALGLKPVPHGASTDVTRRRQLQVLSHAVKAPRTWPLDHKHDQDRQAADAWRAELRWRLALPIMRAVAVSSYRCQVRVGPGAWSLEGVVEETP